MPPRRVRFDSDDDDDLFDSLFNVNDGSDMDLASITPEPTNSTVTPTDDPSGPRLRYARPFVPPRRISRSGSSDLSLLDTVDRRRAQATSNAPGGTGNERPSIATGSRGTAGQRGMTRAAAIDLTGDDSDEDEPVLMGQAGPGPRTRGYIRPVVAPRRANLRGNQDGGRGDGSGMIAQNEFAQEMQNINRALLRRREEAAALVAADQQDERRRLILSPPAPGPVDHRPNPTIRRQPRPGFGGAVLRRGDQQINYDAAGAQRRRLIHHGADDPRFGRDLVQEGLPGPAARPGAVRNAGALTERLERLRRRQDHAMERIEARRRGGIDDMDDFWADDSDDGDYDPNAEEEVEINRRPWADAVRAVARPVVPALAPPPPPGQEAGGLAGLLGGGWRDLFRRFGGAAGNNNIPGIPDLQAGVLANLPGPAAFAGRGPDGVSAILARVTPFHFTPAQAGFTTDFEDPSEKEPITLDDDGKVVKNALKPSPFLSCVMCHDPLLNSSYYRSDDDRVWALRCGHLIDQKCLVKLSTPTSQEPEEPEEPPTKRKRGSRKVPKRVQIVEHEYACPVVGCEGKCTSVLEGETWEQKDGEGALVAFV